MKKFTLLAFESYKKPLLKELQKFGETHFKDLSDSGAEELQALNADFSPEEIEKCETELGKVKFSMSRIEPYAPKLKGAKAMTAEPKSMSFDEFDVYPDSYDYESVYNVVKTEDEAIEAIKTRISALYAENEGLRSWAGLDVSVKELDSLKFTKYLTGTVSKPAAESFKSNAEENFKEAHVEFIGSVKDDVIALILMPSGQFDEALQFFKTLGFSRLSLSLQETPSDVISANNDEITKLRGERNAAFDRVKALSEEYEKLQIVHDYYETLLERERACQNFLKMRTTVLIEGWVPEENSQAFKGIVENICGGGYYLEEEDVEQESETVPIKLKNNKVVSAFEDITVMFSLPRYNEIDPTPLLAPFYWLFFGLMIGDAGYGLLLLVATLVLMKAFKLSEGTKRFMQFFFYLSFAVILGGFIYGSAFGYSFFTPLTDSGGGYKLNLANSFNPIFSPDSGVDAKALIDTEKDIIPMMIGSVALGIIQVLFGIGVKGYMLIRDGKPLAAVFDSLFWIIALITGVGMIVGFTGMIPAALVSVIQWTFLASLIGLAVTQGRENKTTAGKIGGGIYAVYGITSYVGDFVSYTRIAALLLSGAYIAYSFNLMATLIPAGILRIIFGSVIFLLGMLINIGLSALGAYVHTCRLQYVEFFGKFFEGGGIPFNAFKLKNKYIKINK